MGVGHGGQNCATLPSDCKTTCKRNCRTATNSQCVSKLQSDCEGVDANDNLNVAYRAGKPGAFSWQEADEPMGMLQRGRLGGVCFAPDQPVFAMRNLAEPMELATNAETRSGFDVEKAPKTNADEGTSACTNTPERNSTIREQSMESVLTTTANTSAISDKSPEKDTRNIQIGEPGAGAYRVEDRYNSAQGRVVTQKLETHDAGKGQVLQGQQKIAPQSKITRSIQLSDRGKRLAASQMPADIEFSQAFKVDKSGAVDGNGACGGLPQSNIELTKDWETLLDGKSADFIIDTKWVLALLDAEEPIVYSQPEGTHGKGMQLLVDVPAGGAALAMKEPDLKDHQIAPSVSAQPQEAPRCEVSPMAHSVEKPGCDIKQDSGQDSNIGGWRNTPNVAEHAAPPRNASETYQQVGAIGQRTAGIARPNVGPDSSFANNASLGGFGAKNKARVPLGAVSQRNTLGTRQTPKSECEQNGANANQQDSQIVSPEVSGRGMEPVQNQSNGRPPSLSNRPLGRRESPSYVAKAESPADTISSRHMNGSPEAPPGRGTPARDLGPTRSQVSIEDEGRGAPPAKGRGKGTIGGRGRGGPAYVQRAPESPDGPARAPARVPRNAVSPGTMVIGFLLPDDSQRSITFTRTPLGMDFAMHSPVEVKSIKPGSHAQELGVESGWAVISVNGNDTSGLNARDVFARLKLGSGALVAG